MSENNLRINLNNRDINLIGTAHVSQESVDEVRNTIIEEKPGMICVELDQGRFNSITQKDSYEKLNLSKIFKEGKGFLLIANLALSSFQRRLGNELGVKPGDEMKAAIQTAMELNIPHSLCDREIQTTLRRAWSGCGLWSKCKLLASLLSSAFTTEKLSAEEIEKLKDLNELDGIMAELSEFLPGVKETLIDERDRYLAAKIWDASGNAEKTVAVVGAGHIPGIKNHIEKIASGSETTDITELDHVPPRGFLSKIAGFIIPAILVALVIVGFFRTGADLSLVMLIRYIIVKGIFAAAGALIALAHPLVIIVTFLCAPFTAFIPVISVGVIAGLLQAALVKPRVSDIQTLSDDITSFKGVYRNRISRALLIFFLSGLGGSIGSFVSIPVLAGLLAG